MNRFLPTRNGYVNTAYIVRITCPNDPGRGQTAHMADGTYEKLDYHVDDNALGQVVPNTIGVSGFNIDVFKDEVCVWEVPIIGFVTDFAGESPEPVTLCGSKVRFVMLPNGKVEDFHQEMTHESLDAAKAFVLEERRKKDEVA